METANICGQFCESNEKCKIDILDKVLNRMKPPTCPHAECDMTHLGDYYYSVLKNGINLCRKVQKASQWICHRYIRVKDNTKYQLQNHFQHAKYVYFDHQQQHGLKKKNQKINLVNHNR